jgi:hypothetical protein
MVLAGAHLRLNQAFVRKRLLLAALSGLGALGVVIGGAGWALHDLNKILVERDVWARGATAPYASVRGKVRTLRLIFREYEIDVDFHDGAGVLHTGHTEFDTVLGRVDTRRKPSVRYLASDPRLFALSWGQDVLLYRGLIVGMIAIAGIGVGVVMLIFPLGILRDLKIARACIEGASEVVLDVVNVRSDAQNAQYKLRGRGPLGHELQMSFMTILASGKPFFVNAGRSQVLGLVPARQPDRVVVVRESFLPFDLTAAEVDRAREQWVKSGSTEAAASRTSVEGSNPQPPLPAIVHHSPLAAIIVGVVRRRKAMRRRSAMSVLDARASGLRDVAGWKRLKSERVCPTCEREIVGGVILCQRCGGLLNPLRWVVLLCVVVVFLALPWVYMWWVRSPFV